MTRVLAYLAFCLGVAVWLVVDLRLADRKRARAQLDAYKRRAGP